MTTVPIRPLPQAAALLAGIQRMASPFRAGAVEDATPADVIALADDALKVLHLLAEADKGACVNLRTGKHDLEHLSLGSILNEGANSARAQITLLKG